MGTPSQNRPDKSCCAARYGDAGVDPLSVGYVEAHGTGTRAGDPVEIGALAAVLGEGRPGRSRCASARSRPTSATPRAPLVSAGLIKAALAVSEGVDPGESAISRPRNPEVPWHVARLRARALPCAGPRMRNSVLPA